jgi:hypothetical protein
LRGWPWQGDNKALLTGVAVAPRRLVPLATPGSAALECETDCGMTGEKMADSTVCRAGRIRFHLIDALIVLDTVVIERKSAATTLDTVHLHTRPTRVRQTPHREPITLCRVCQPRKIGAKVDDMQGHL